MGWWEQRSGLDGRVAVVTGGAGGLGEAITLDLAANGVAVAYVDRDQAAVDDLTRRLEADGARVAPTVGDVRAPEVLAGVFDDVDRRWGRLDILVNVVGGTFKAPFTETVPKGWDVLVRTNLDHVLHASSLAVPRIRAGGRGGSIVNLTTIEAHRAAPNFAVYSAAKAAVTQFARSLAVELAPDGIRVNNVAPDITPTPAMGDISASSSSVVTPLGASVAIPMGRVGVPTDVSGCVVFLVSDLGAYVTGTTLHPDGGAWASSGWFNWPGEGWLNSVPSRLLDHLPVAADDADPGATPPT